MGEENINQEFRLKNIEEIKNYFIKEIDQRKLLSKKHKKGSTILKYIEHYFSLRDYWMRFNFCFCFFTWYSYKNYKF